MRIPTKYLILTPLFSALTIIGAFIKIPFPLAPLTLQILFVLMSGFILGPKYGALSQILSQLIHNSYYHGFKGNKTGEISINCKLMHSNSIEITYSDNGKGLELETKHKIFEPFFSTDRKNHTGLGLTIAQNLVNNKLKGTIVVSTSADEGVEFRINIPF